MANGKINLTDLKAFDTYKETHAATYGAGAGLLLLLSLHLNFTKGIWLVTFLNIWVLFPFKTDRIADTLKMNVRGEEHYFIGIEILTILLYIIGSELYGYI